MFLGEHPHAVDDKGRVALPTKFREALAGLQDGRLVATKFWIEDRPCLDVYPLSSWANSVERRMLAADQLDPDVLAFANLYVAPAQELACDKHGRILLSPLLREHAGIKRDVMVVGYMALFRIWDHATWLALRAGQQERAPEIVRRFLRS